MTSDDLATPGLKEHRENGFRGPRDPLARTVASERSHGDPRRGVAAHRVFITSRQIDRNVDQKRPKETLIGRAQLRALKDEIRETKRYVA